MDGWLLKQKLIVKNCSFTYYSISSRLTNQHKVTYKNNCHILIKRLIYGTKSYYLNFYKHFHTFGDFLKNTAADKNQSLAIKLNNFAYSTLPVRYVTTRQVRYLFILAMICKRWTATEHFLI